MPVYDLVYLLNNYHPSNEERAFKERMLTFIQAHADCFERTLAEGHITASSWLLNKDGSKALLMHHAKLNQWFQLGGHCDGNPDVLAVAIKEAQEESGINDIVPVSTEIFDIDIHLIPARKQEAAHFHYDVRFLLQVASDEVIVPNHESHDLRWVGKNQDDIPPVGVSVTRMFHKWVQRS